MVEQGIDYLHLVTDMKAMLEEAGFCNITVASIGSHVWRGWDAWISQQEDFKDTWDVNWYRAYQAGFIDYYEITATKSD